MAETSAAFDSSSNSNVSRSKRRKLGLGIAGRASAEPSGARWRTEAEEQIYSTKLSDALRRLRRTGVTGRSVRDAADRVLAVSSKGKTRWGRAILTGRLSFQMAQINRRRKRAVKPASGVKRPAAARMLPPLQRKVKVLSGLVPGCRKLSLPTLLEETTDYIAALEMQMKAMTFLTGLLNSAAPAPSDRPL